MQSEGRVRNATPTGIGRIYLRDISPISLPASWAQIYATDSSSAQVKDGIQKNCILLLLPTPDPAKSLSSQL